LKDLKFLERDIEYDFKDKNLLKTALTHTSYAYEKNVKSYERLEYLGDSILEFISSEYLFLNYNYLSEGEMTKVRAYAVCEDSLYNIALKHNFSDFLLLGKSEISSNDSKKAILADCVEAIIAAIYLDSMDMQIVRKFVIENIKAQVEYSSKHVGEKDYKTALQELLQVNGDILIQYKIIKEEGPDHDKSFTAEVLVEGKKIAEGIGKSKKNAEMDAAKYALEIYKAK